MIQPTGSAQRPTTLATHTVGDYRRVLASAQAGAAQGGVIAPAPVPAPVLAPPATSPAPVAPAAQKGLVARLIDWLKSLFGPVTPTPTPGPVTPTPGPVTPTPGPVTPGPSGVDVFFTNTYAGTKGGMTNAQATAANKATSQADANNPDKQLVAMIDAVPAGGTLDGAFFDIDVPNVVDAFARAAQRGEKVRLATESDYYYEPNSKTELRPAIKQLLAAGVEIKDDKRDGALMHDKFLVVNGQSVWTGSYNITEGGSYGENNNAMRIDSRELADVYEAEFQKMFVKGNFGTDTAEAAHPGPTTVQIGDASFTPYFSPSKAAQGGAKAAVLAELAKAQKSIQFLSFSYTDADMGDLMLQKAQAGVKVEGVFEKSQAASRYSQYNKLNAAEPTVGANMDVRIDTNPALMHHKVILVDDSTLIMGSFIYSASAQNDNDENLIVIKNAPDLVAKYKAEFGRVQNVAV
jgi:phosphatidylserine/phosphatidylglycerophosphate/cardiolipin synthase-like enzyme